MFLFAVSVYYICPSIFGDAGQIVWNFILVYPIIILLVSRFLDCYFQNYSIISATAVVYYMSILVVLCIFLFFARRVETNLRAESENLVETDGSSCGPCLTLQQGL